MNEPIQVGDRVKWKRLIQFGYIIFRGMVTVVEVGATDPCAHVQPASGGAVQRIELSSLLRADDKAEPQANEWDLLLQRDGMLPWSSRYTDHGCTSSWRYA